MQAVPIRLLGNAVEMRDHFLLLKWLIFTAVSVFGFVLLWHFEMIQGMVERDVSYISLVILIVYALTSVHALSVTVEMSSEINTAHRVREQIMGGTEGYRVIGGRVLLSDGTELLPGVLTSHIRDLVNKARRADGNPIDQTPLMRSLADKLRGKQNLGHLSSDLQLKLGLLGTIVGFIYMLLPLDSLEDFSVASMKSVLTFMSTGMGVALYTTLAGLVGAILVKIQYYFIDDATHHLFELTTELTEVQVVPILDKGAVS